MRLKLPREFGFDIVALTPREFSERSGRAFFKEVSRYWIEIKP
ncbi:MAG: hypothetical protein QXE91_08675 [Thermofilaceae archaeon]